MDAGGALGMPTSSLQCPSKRGLTPRQVAASGKGFGGRAVVSLAWRRRCCKVSQRTGPVRVIAMAGRKKAAGNDGEKERPELQLEANDLMELEFGRLLGEPRHATLAKVIGRKVNPSSSYIDIEKKSVKEFKSSSSSELSEAEFARLLNKEGRRNAQPLEGVYKPPKVTSEEDLPGLVKPPSRPGQPLPQQASRRAPSVSSSKPGQAKQALPLVTFGPGGFVAQANKPRLDETDYMNRVQKPAIASPDSYKPSWPKLDTVPPMLLNKSKRPVESVDDSVLRRPAVPGDTTGTSGVERSDLESRVMEDLKAPREPSKSKRSSSSKLSAIASPDNSEERFAELLEIESSIGEDQRDVSTTTTVESRSKPRRTLPVGRKPVLAAQPPVQEEEIREAVAMATSSNDVPKDSPRPAVEVEVAGLEENVEPIDSGADSDVNLTSASAAADSTKGDEQQPDPEQSVLRLMNKASRIAPVRPLPRFPQAIPVATKARVLDSSASADDRLAGWSEEVKAAVKRSEAALPGLGAPAPSETEFEQLLERRKAELRRRPVPPQSPESLPDPAEVSAQQRAFSRPLVPSPKPARDAATTANGSPQAGVPLSEKRTPSSSKEEEDQDWARAEALRESKTVEEVVLTRAISNGMLANFGSLVGFLAAYELSSSRRPPSFSAWAQDRGFRINRKLKTSSENEDLGAERSGGADEEYKRLLDVYGKFRTELLSALIGKTAKVVVVAVERERKQLRFSEKEADGEGQELAQKRAKLMTSLDVGDVVKCTVKKVTNFGAFVELQGVPALIHISELSWNRVTDPSTILQVGQEVEVKVCRLDRYLQRISLSLKQMQPDPLRETLESLDLQGTPLHDEEEIPVMPELVGLIKRLEAYKGIDRVQIGRRIQANALAPTFQVYLSDQLDDGFKLLARSGNLVQEVLVQTALDRDSMKDAIRLCTFSD